MRLRKQTAKKSTHRKRLSLSSGKLSAPKCIIDQTTMEEEKCSNCLAPIDSPAKPNVCQVCLH